MALGLGARWLLQSYEVLYLESLVSHVYWCIESIHAMQITPGIGHLRM